MKKDDKRKIFIFVALIISMLMVVFGITFALYSKLLIGNTSNIINTGTLNFSFDEGSFSENGIRIYDAYPIPDSVGKLQTGNRKYFDFAVNGKTTIGDIKYEVVAVKQSDSTLNEKFVKIYLTKLDGNTEMPSELVINNNVVKTFYELEDSTRQEGKIIYVGKISNNVDYHQTFRLRMWMSDSVTENDDVFNKSFSIKVNVLGIQ